ncbi:hypothetical protein DFR33_103382 [Bradymonas sediminis]|nr:hypothetical protein DFR33_103382 [Bradymonas sediminis]
MTINITREYEACSTLSLAGISLSPQEESKAPPFVNFLSRIAFDL